MEHYDAEWLDLAPRDIVARSIQAEMMANSVPHVYLDLRSYVSREEILHHFPNIYDYCLRYGVDITRDLVPVAPAAHYSCGGIQVDDWGRTNLPGLYAVGEVACTGLHGANRLASTSLLEGLVWGDRAARLIDATLADQLRVEPPQLVSYQPINDLPEPDTRQIERYRKVVQDLMWQHVGLVRTTECLEHALNRLRRLEFDIETFYRRCRPTDALIGLRNLVQVALLVTAAALENEVSQGCHYRI
jgi:L-aspartate oxidase